MGRVDDFDLILSYAHGLDQDDVLSHCIHDVHNILGGAGETSEASAGRQGTDENPFVRRMALHPDPISQDCSPRKWTRRVDGDHSDSLSFLTEGIDHLVDNGRFSGSRRARDPDDIGLSCAGIELLQVPQG